MSISTGTISLPRRIESLRQRYAGPISLDTLNGKLASHVAPGGQGSVFVDFSTARPDMPPHSGVGSIVLYDGASIPILSCSSAEIQVEQGEPLAGWSGVTVGNLVARGIDEQGRVIAFRKVGFDETSVLVEFAVADDAKGASWVEVLKWAMAVPA